MPVAVISPNGLSKLGHRRRISQRVEGGSAVFENYQFEDLPLAVEIDVPLGDNDRSINHSPVVRFVETNTGITLGGQGASTGYQYFEGEFFVSGLGTYSIKYRLVLPEE